MAISENILLKKLSGQIGRQLVIKQYGDKTVVCKYPTIKKRKPTRKQLRNRQIMEQANYEAQYILSDDTLRKEAQVRLNVTRNKLYHALIREYFTAAKKNEVKV